MKKQIVVLSITIASIFYGYNANAQQEGMIGEIRMFGGNFAPRGWALCQGQLLSISSNQALFSILGTTFGGDGRTTFALPDLRGRVPIQHGNGPGLPSYSLGERGGAYQNFLTVLQLPSHNHAVTLRGAEEGNSDDPTNNFIAATGSAIFNTASTVNMGSVTSQNTGSNQAVNNMQPFLGVNYIICLTGVFPSRN